MAVKIVIRVHLNQADAIREISRIRSAGFYWYGFVILAVNDDDRYCKRNRLEIAEPIYLKIVPDGDLLWNST